MQAPVQQAETPPDPFINVGSSIYPESTNTTYYQSGSSHRCRIRSMCCNIISSVHRLRHHHPRTLQHHQSWDQAPSFTKATTAEVRVLNVGSLHLAHKQTATPECRNIITCSGPLLCSYCNRLIGEATIASIQFVVNCSRLRRLSSACRKERGKNLGKICSCFFVFFLTEGIREEKRGKVRCGQIRCRKVPMSGYLRDVDWNKVRTEWRGRTRVKYRSQPLEKLELI